jgi:hypothetical protein
MTPYGKIQVRPFFVGSTGVEFIAVTEVQKLLKRIYFVRRRR